MEWAALSGGRRARRGERVVECGLVMGGVAQEAAVKVNHSQVAAQVAGSPREREGLQGGDALRKGVWAGTGHFVAEKLDAGDSNGTFLEVYQEPVVGEALK